MSGIILHITAGQGPAECEWVVVGVAAAFRREAATAGLTCTPVEPLAGPSPSIMLRVEGETAEAFVAARVGTVRWVGKSIFRPVHKRKNWFVGVSRVAELKDMPDVQEHDIVYQTMRASGPGGQHVNKTDSAVRATHVPSGLSAVSQAQRSQRANKITARLKLALMLRELREKEVVDGKSALWAHNHNLERGNAVRTYEGVAFRLRR
jgi:peptide chain release factor